MLRQLENTLKYENYDYFHTKWEIKIDSTNYFTAALCVCVFIGIKLINKSITAKIDDGTPIKNGIGALR